MAEKNTQYQLIDAVSVNVGRLIRYGSIVLVCRYVYLGVAVLAGRSTAAQFLVQILASVRISTIFSWSFAMSGLGYGWLQRRLRRRTIREKADRIRELEKLLDSNRASSGLTPDGSSRTEDGG